ncbi:3-methyl-2-oxobutanoate hydroxymethyltransferase [Chromobacterium violaceum]|uniref:3-methyl-2-oxobutanoate hydroxymethyltransferase n=1 Tax=Chromobacterium violaceum TaxID=536 RepID=A0A447TAK5_CHRVL|nr:3-methyl-2-oxobutanoate hydroxymethyltransferase [Chromobacterium violaceum]
MDSTLPVSEEDMLYHIRCVARGAKNALILGDMTFGAYQESPQQAFAHAARLLQAGAHMVKLEGGAYMAETTRFLVERGIPVCSHIGLTPQYVNMFGGYRVQGRGEDAQRILNDAKVLAEAGASLVLMECVPAPLAKEITETVKAPTIGIGAARTRPARCWCCTTCWACIRARRPSSSRTSWKRPAASRALSRLTSRR